MKIKKNKELQLEKNSSLYFALGLCLVLALTYIALEWKTFHSKSGWEVAKLDRPDVLPDEIIPILLPPEPLKPKYVPSIIEEVPDDVTMEETFFEAPNPDQETKVVPIDSIASIDDFEDESIPIFIIEEAPIFPGCENAKDKKACFQEMMLKHVRKNFSYPKMAVEMDQEGKVFVQFTIQKDGSINDLRLRGPHKILEKEAARIISKLPQMTPGKQRGTPVKVPFSIPIHFVLQ